MPAASRPTTPHVTPSGTRAGWSALDVPPVAAAAPASGASEVASPLPGASLVASSPRPPFVPPLVRSFAPSVPAVAGESLGDSRSRGDALGLSADLEGEACGEDDPVAPPPAFPPGEGLEDGLEDGLDVPPAEPPDVPPVDPPDVPPEEPPDVPPEEPPDVPPDVPPVGEDEGDGVGDGLGDDDWVTGGATPGGTAEPAARSCCHDHPTEPPAGTVSVPTPEDEYVQDPFEPSAHHRPQ